MPIVTNKISTGRRLISYHIFALLFIVVSGCNHDRETHFNIGKLDVQPDLSEAKSAALSFCRFELKKDQFERWQRYEQNRNRVKFLEISSAMYARTKLLNYTVSKINEWIQFYETKLLAVDSGDCSRSDFQKEGDLYVYLVDQKSFRIFNEGARPTKEEQHKMLEIKVRAYDRSFYVESVQDIT